MYDFVITGAGLAGLEFGYLMAKKGSKVCVLEKDSRIGGCLQTFKRNGMLYDTGFHYVGGLDEGQPLNTLFKELDLLDLPWKRLDNEAFDEVIIGDEHYFFANGFDNFAEKIITDCKSNGHEISKESAEGIFEYARFLKDVGDNIFNVLNDAAHSNTMDLFARSAYQFLKDTIKDDKLIGVVSGTSMKLELRPETLPLYTFAQINSSFIRSAWRLEGGGMQIADKLAEGIRNFGGDVITNAKVTKFIENEGVIKAVEINNGEETIEGKDFISSIHPGLTLDLIPKEGSRIKNIFRKRIANLGNTYGMFTVNMKLKDGVVPYKNRNIYIHNSLNSIWQQSEYQPDLNSRSLMISYQVPTDGSMFTKNIDILMPMYWNELTKWEDTKVGRRGEEYEEMKHRLAEKCIEKVAEYIPELKGNIEDFYTSTPLTYRDYTGTIEGSAYGIRKDCNNSLMTVLAPNTAIPNLYMTGQNLNLHGVLGVTMTAFMLYKQGNFKVK